MLNNCKFCKEKTNIQIFRDLDEDGLLKTTIRCNRCTQHVTRNTPQGAGIAWNVAQENKPRLCKMSDGEFISQVMPEA